MGVTGAVPCTSARTALRIQDGRSLDLDQEILAREGRNGDCGAGGAGSFVKVLIVDLGARWQSAEALMPPRAYLVEFLVIGHIDEKDGEINKVRQGSTRLLQDALHATGGKLERRRIGTRCLLFDHTLGLPCNRGGSLAGGGTNIHSEHNIVGLTGREAGEEEERSTALGVRVPSQGRSHGFAKDGAGCPWGWDRGWHHLRIVLSDRAILPIGEAPHMGAIATATSALGLLRDPRTQTHGND